MFGPSHVVSFGSACRITFHGVSPELPGSDMASVLIIITFLRFMMMCIIKTNNEKKILFVHFLSQVERNEAYIDGYHIKYNMAGSEQPLFETVTGQKMKPLTGLSPYTEYSIRVQPFKRSSDNLEQILGPWSGVVTRRTGEDSKCSSSKYGTEWCLSPWDTRCCHSYGGIFDFAIEMSTIFF